MKYLIRTALALALLALALPVIAKGPLDVYVRYAGYGHDTSVEMVEDGMPVNLTEARGKGTFGNSMVTITVEFVEDEGMIGNCPDGYDLPFAFLDVPDLPEHMWAFVITGANHDQVYGFFDTGWLCMTADKRHWVGEGHGVFYGGTGRYESATGTWQSHFSGTNLDPSIGFRSITGDVVGTLYLD